MSEDEKAPYRLMSEHEKREHQQKYPDYRFTPGIRITKPVKRNVKRNGQNDLARSQRVAELLKAGLQGRDLESAVKDIDLDSLGSSSPPAEESSRSSSSSPAATPSSAPPDVRGWQPTGRETEAGVLRSPLLAPPPAPTVVQPLPVTRRSVCFFLSFRILLLIIDSSDSINPPLWTT
ncbi:hypothetical protein BDP27DRAFT_380272 [Rhodocollybia butyracea]|uniref:Uncharacterized protein n=1 Tax=Rhodocollybia butyracea TaxID=206335 RepID=A0A9P5UA42_9AGAR|nr:hypothetical protein BDP27DRAFT_380272 [Rhodocollybia butyracea]